jgi:hypothetical protein
MIIRRKRMLWLLCCLFGSAMAGSAGGQIAPRLTGSVIIGQLEAAQHDLAARAVGLPDSSLAMTSRHLGAIAAGLRRTLGNDASKPIDTLGSAAKGSAYRASAAAQRTQAYLAASSGCLGGDAAAMANALAANVDALAGASDSSKMQPVINAVETLDHRPLFVLRRGSAGAAFALTGDNLFDSQCDSPVVTATDMQGRLQALQPTVTGMLPNRIELSLPQTMSLQPGSYVLHVVAKRKAFLVGCTAQPEAVAAVQVAPSVKASVSYAVTAMCRQPNAADGSAHALPAITGTLPDLASGSTTSRHIVVVGCPDPVSYAITAKVEFSDGHSATIGPIAQIASAGITAGLPGGLSLSWDPSVQQLFVRSGGNSCKGVY